MSANPIIYCLQHLTDYRQFERLCSDIMASSGYREIEPIGGTGDRGRDAIHVSRVNSKLTVFAYTVRNDWRIKLSQDCKRIQEENHCPNEVVFVCTSELSGTDKDKAKEKTKDEFGWTLEIYDLERIRVLLSTELRHLVAQHPAIFCPPWFAVKGGLSISECRDTIVIDHVSDDHSLATWLAKKLLLSGYKVWCYGLSPLAGEDKDESVGILIDKRACQYIPLISNEVFKDMEFIGRMSLAIRMDSFVIPCWAENMQIPLSNHKILQVESARFDRSWSVGLQAVLNQLQARAIKTGVDVSRGKEIALKAYMPVPVTKPVSETVFSNVFSVTVPGSILVCELKNKLNDKEIEALRLTFAFVKVTPQKLLSFDNPPISLPLIKAPRLAEYSWGSIDTFEGKKSINIVKELIRRSLNVSCTQAGLGWCPDRQVPYFKEENGKQHNIRFTHVDGQKTHVAATGIRQYSWGERATKFRYQLSPNFRVDRDEEGKFWVMTRVYIRVTDLDGKPFEKKEITKKRKAVAKNWWNRQWLARTLGVMHGLANTENNEFIEIGSEDKRKVVVSTKPLDWECPISIDAEVVDRIGDFQEEMAAARSFEEKDPDTQDNVTSGEQA